MNTLVLLYFLYLEFGGVGQGKVSILAISRYMRKSKSQMKKSLSILADMGLVEIFEKFGAGNYKKYLISLSPAGQMHLDENWNEALAAYRAHVAETVALINERNSGKFSDERKLSKAEMKLVAAGQKEMF